LLATGGSFEQEKDKWRAEVILWDAKNGEMKQTLSTDLSVPGVLSLAFSSDGKTLAVAGGLVGDAKDGGKSSGEMRLITLK
jgi:WD40 repeat protein